MGFIVIGGGQEKEKKRFGFHCQEEGVVGESKRSDKLLTLGELSLDDEPPGKTKQGGGGTKGRQWKLR